MGVVYRNHAEAFLQELRHLVTFGERQTVRGSETVETLTRVVAISHPLERCVVVPHRRNDPFAMIAETMWVLAGRDDLGYLSHYLPRALEFSDDGRTWRGAYGPRLRAWAGVDQLAAAIDLLRRDPQSRRAVITLYDPARDFEPTKDVPCNNWLHFMIRNGRLHLNVAIRSNDIMWGFSGINTFEWSVLQEMMAYWLGVPTGTAAYFISSLHLYDRHYQRADLILDAVDKEGSPQSSGAGPQFATSWNDMPTVLAEWFALEEKLRADEDITNAVDAFRDPLLRDFLRMLLVRRMHLAGEPEQQVRAQIGRLGGRGHRVAAIESLYGEVTKAADRSTVGSELGELGSQRLRRDIVMLHRTKDAAYGPSWKKRGELLGIMANIARKADRLEALAGGAPEGAESLLDTVVDLFVYCLKYETYLADLDPILARKLFGSAVAPPFSDGTEPFEHLLDGLMPERSGAPVSALITQTITAFACLEAEVLKPGSTHGDRFICLHRLAASSYALANALTADVPLTATAVSHGLDDATPRRRTQSGR